MIFWPLFVGSFHNLCFQNQERKVLRLQTVMSKCSPCTYSWKKVGTYKPGSPFFFFRPNSEKNTKKSDLLRELNFWSNIVFRAPQNLKMWLVKFKEKSLFLTMPAPSRQSGLSHTWWRLFHHYWWYWTIR